MNFCEHVADESKKTKERAIDVRQTVVASETLPRVVSTDFRKGKRDPHVQNVESLVNLPPNPPAAELYEFYWNPCISQCIVLEFDTGL